MARGIAAPSRLAAAMALALVLAVCVPCRSMPEEGEAGLWDEGEAEPPALGTQGGGQEEADPPTLEMQSGGAHGGRASHPPDVPPPPLVLEPDEPAGAGTKLAFVAHHGLLARSYHHVRASQRKHVFDVLERAGYRVFTFVHAWDLAEPIDNPRAGEVGLDVHPVKDVLPLVPHLVRYQVEDQATSLEGVDVDEYTFNGWVRNSKDSFPATRANYVRALISLDRVTQMMAEYAKGHRRPDLVVFLRPDLEFCAPLVLENLADVNGVCYTRNKLGDRLAYGSWEGMEAYGTRFRVANSDRFKRVGCLELAECLSDWVVKKFERYCSMAQGSIGRVRASGEMNSHDRRTMDRYIRGGWHMAARHILPMGGTSLPGRMRGGAYGSSSGLGSQRYWMSRASSGGIGRWGHDRHGTDPGAVPAQRATVTELHGRAMAARRWSSRRGQGGPMGAYFEPRQGLRQASTQRGSSRSAGNQQAGYRGGGYHQPGGLRSQLQGGLGGGGYQQGSYSGGGYRQGSYRGGYQPHVRSGGYQQQGGYQRGGGGDLRGRPFH